VRLHVYAGQEPTSLTIFEVFMHLNHVAAVLLHSMT
jgi:hypothetical protein